jgi:lipopolysaccharide/colanic/teichoic acid biosynthesis glycosyltransferase
METANAMKQPAQTSMTNTSRQKPDLSGLAKFSVRLRLSFKPEQQDVLVEGEFRRMLCLERKRAERSSRRFVLMLLNVEKLLGVDRSGRMLAGVVSAVSRCVRETDVQGWYQENAILGVVFTELGAAGVDAFARLTRVRLMRALKERIVPEAIKMIGLSFHFFPNRRDQSRANQLPNEELYPDLLEKDKEKNVLRVLKRAMDIAGSAAALIVLAPLFGVIAVAIKLTSPGPVLFRQERVGQCGRRFTFLKFRSMKCGNDPAIHKQYVRNFIAKAAQPRRTKLGQAAIYKIQDDPRVTPVGRFLRRTSLDELPQFINVLKGEMSLVGPRPPIPYELESYRSWHWRRVLEVKPGITGLWQVNGRSKTTFDEMVRLDLRYARTWSPWLDIKILLETPRSVLSGAGAY